MLIRPLSSDDLAVFRALRLRALACDPDAFGGTFADESARPDERWSEWLRKATGGAQAVLVACGAGGALGMCGAYITDDDPAVGMIWGMFVEPDVRGAGVAGDLLAAAERFVLGCGALRVAGRVADGNARAIAFYRRNGYAVGAACGPLRAGSAVTVFPIEKELARMGAT